MENPDLVHIVDDDLSVREALSSLIRSAGLSVRTYSSAIAFLDAPRPAGVACLVLDVRMPGMTGIELQQALARAGDAIPIIFITAQGDIPMAVRAMKEGAAEFLPKPFRDADLLGAINTALSRARAAQKEYGEIDGIRRKYASLTGREKEVIAYVIKGSLNKQAAAELGVTEMTVKVHRHNVMRKMGAASIPDLVRMMERLQP